MRLPDNAIGISDINKYRDCGRRMVYQLRRFTEGEEPPEDLHPDTMYGTIIHEAYNLLEEEDLSDEAAIQRAFDRYAAYLGPDDLGKLRTDLRTYRERDYVGVRTVANEREVRVPLLTFCYRCNDRDGGDPGCTCGKDDEHVLIYFRGKIDRLYQRLDDPTVFIHVDYKSSKWEKREEEVHSDTQMWAYNWAIHEVWPECESLTQLYDQLRYGVIPTRKSPAQREEMREWLVRQVTAILKDEEPQARFNEWCPWCPIKYDCPVIDRLSDFEKARIEALMPEDPDPSKLGEYVKKVDDAETAIKTLESFTKRVKSAVRELPEEEQRRLGYRMSGRSFDVWDADALERVHEVLGPDFYRVVKMTKTAVNSFLGDDERREVVLDLSRKEEGAAQLRRARK